MTDAQPAVDAGVWGETLCLGCRLENEGRGLFGNRDIRAKESKTCHGATGDHLYWFTLEPGLLFNEILHKRSYPDSEVLHSRYACPGYTYHFLHLGLQVPDSLHHMHQGDHINHGNANVLLVPIGQRNLPARNGLDQDRIEAERILVFTSKNLGAKTCQFTRQG